MLAHLCTLVLALFLSGCGFSGALYLPEEPASAPREAPASQEKPAPENTPAPQETHAPEESPGPEETPARQEPPAPDSAGNQSEVPQP